MSSKRNNNPCEKCLHTNNRKEVKFRVRENDTGNSLGSDSQKDLHKLRKRSKTTWKKTSYTKQNSSLFSKLGIPHLRNKRLRLDSPYESVIDRTNSLTSPKSGILKRRSSSPDAVTQLPTKSGINEEEEPITSEIYEIPSVDMFEKRSKKIRFMIPEGTLGYEDAKNAMWRSRKECIDCVTSPFECESFESSRRLKFRDDGVIESDLNDIEKYMVQETEREMEDDSAVSDVESSEGESEL